MAEEDQKQLQPGLTGEAANLPKIMNQKYQHDLAHTTGVLPFHILLLDPKGIKEDLFNYKTVSGILARNAASKVLVAVRKIQALDFLSRSMTENSVQRAA